MKLYVGTCNSQGECICSSKFDNISTASGYRFCSCYQCEKQVMNLY